MSEEIKEKRDCAKCCVPLNTVKARLNIVLALFVILLGGNAWSLVSADDTSSAVIHATNTEAITHLKEEDRKQALVDERLDREHKSLSKTVNRVDKNVERLLGAMGVPSVPVTE